jgi:RNA polymerase sigma-70 factor (ECF subfamily)
MNEQEERWVHEARAGKKESFSRLVEAYQRPVYNLTHRLLGNAQDAEEAAQETFLRAYARLRQYHGRHKFGTWLLSIANHYAIDRLRRRRVQLISLEATPLLRSLEDIRQKPEEYVLKQEQTVELLGLLERLEPENLTPLVLRYGEDYSNEEIAEAMGLTVPAVKSRLFRARKQMFALLQAKARKAA